MKKKTLKKCSKSDFSGFVKRNVSQVPVEVDFVTVLGCRSLLQCECSAHAAARRMLRPLAAAPAVQPQAPPLCRIRAVDAVAV